MVTAADQIPMPLCSINRKKAVEGILKAIQRVCSKHICDREDRWEDFADALSTKGNLNADFYNQPGGLYVRIRFNVVKHWARRVSIGRFYSDKTVVSQCRILILNHLLEVQKEAYEEHGLQLPEDRGNG